MALARPWPSTPRSNGVEKAEHHGVADSGVMKWGHLRGNVGNTGDLDERSIFVSLSRSHKINLDPDDLSPLEIDPARSISANKKRAPTIKIGARKIGNVARCARVTLEGRGLTIALRR